MDSCLHRLAQRPLEKNRKYIEDPGLSASRSRQKHLPPAAVEPSPTAVVEGLHGGLTNHWQLSGQQLPLTVLLRACLIFRS
jgi:hypothetical protein